MDLEDFQDVFDTGSYQEAALAEELECQLGEVTDLLTKIPQNPNSPLYNVDYNLNSPLITDHVEALRTLLTGYDPPKRLKYNLNVRRQAASLRAKPMNWRFVKAADHFHSWVSTGVLNKTLTTSYFHNQWNPYATENLSAMQVVLEFWEDLTQQHVTTAYELLRARWFFGTPLSEWHKRLLEDGEAFWFFHIVVLLMNSKDEEERTNLIQQGNFLQLTSVPIPVKSKWDKGSFLITGLHPDFGEFRVGPGCLLLVKDERLLDRNMTLMIKDTLVARFCSKLSLLNKIGELRDEEHVRNLTHLYRAGDELIKHMGSEGYRVLQLLEPVCNLRLAEIASSFRPEIPTSPRFREFLKGEISEADKLSPGAVHCFFDIILGETDFKQILIYYGVFRHWGHPFIDYFAGLKKLHEQVQMEKDIDEAYAESLASDLAYIVLKHEFDRQKKWFVDATQMDIKDPLYEHVRNCTWPTPQQIQDIGDRWHKLPLRACYEIPQTIDPSVLFADKSHSPNYSEVFTHIASGKEEPIPSRKVLKTALDTPHRNLVDFLQEVNDHGLPKDSLTIGLKGKERELKDVGRFFSLMTWDLREYFVSTEYLIKMYYVPLFEGLTMADDLKSVTRKILECTTGHGQIGYKVVSFANHLDYEKWNNHQRKKSTFPVFKVMGQFLGMPNLFAQTHDFFEQSFVYYGERPDLMTVQGGKIVNNTEHIVCWNGQLGGLEGLRQKGWSVLNLLVILRESKIRNTQVRVLAQGDNQVICTRYKIPENLDLKGLRDELTKVFKNNMTIIDAITAGANKLGLLINQKETLIASDYLTYSKVPVFRGNIYPHEVKRYSRVTCIPNDQVPTVASAVSAVATSSLTVAQFSNSILNPLACFCLFGTMVLAIHRFHSPLLKKAILLDASPDQVQSFVIRALFLDPVLGGTSGTSPTRFLIRQFPDPVTESLSFWKRTWEITKSPVVRNIALEAGHPQLAAASVDNLSKLLEKPMSLNIPKGLSAITLLKGEIRRGLTENIIEIRNDLVVEALKFQNAQEHKIKNFLLTIRPMFPRFLSEFYSATFIGITESILGLFQNSRTIRTTLSYKFGEKIGILLTLSEALSVKVSAKRAQELGFKMWDCSSQHADHLRQLSWGMEIKGTTVPHPYEMIRHYTIGSALCSECPKGFPEKERITVDFPHGFPGDFTTRGPLSAYLGSATSESTSLFQPWEKETKIPLLERATRLRVAINWFVMVDSNVAHAIFENLRALTGLDWSEVENIFSRTGSALHRFRSARQSNGGFSAISPNGPMWVMVTADTMPELSRKNYDFMYQSLMLYAQTVSLEVRVMTTIQKKTFHYHVRCIRCVREIEEVKLTTHLTLTLPDVSSSITRMSGGIMPDFSTVKSLHIQEGVWTELSVSERCFHVGVAQGALYGFYYVDNDKRCSDTSLFPVSVLPYLNPRSYLIGILKGILMAASYHMIYRRNVVMLTEPRSALISAAYYIIEAICRESSFISVLNKDSFLMVLTEEGHRVSPSYPSSGVHLGSMGVGFLGRHLTRKTLSQSPWTNMSETVWIFSDFKSPKLAALMLLSHRLWVLVRGAYIPKTSQSLIREIKDIIHYYCSKDVGSHSDHDPEILKKSLLTPVLSVGRWCPREVRHAVQSLPIYQHIPKSSVKDWGKETRGSVTVVELDFTSQPTEKISDLLLLRVNDPLISGLRPFQMATGAHYKLRCLLRMIPIVEDFLVGGDGSGGMTSSLLREYQDSRCIFNSLLDLSDRHLRGVAPSPPAAIAALPVPMRDRCVNLKTAWENPSDLCETDTWEHFQTLITHYDLNITLMVFDMEVVAEWAIVRIVELVRRWIHKLLSPEGTLIFKMYATRELASRGETVSRIGCLFKRTFAATTQYSSFGSSEFYLVCIHPLSEKAAAMFVETSSLRRCLAMVGAAKDPEEEFKRAQTVIPADMWRGVPSHMRPDPKVEFIGVFSQLGLETGVAADLAEMLEARCETPLPRIGLVLAVLALLSNSILPITRWITPPYCPPSDQSLQKLLSGFVGCWEFIAWSYNWYSFHSNLQLFLFDAIQFHYRLNPREMGKSRGFSLEWTFTRLDWSFKRLPRLEHHATVGQVIRCLAAFWPSQATEGLPPPNIIQNIMAVHLKSYNKSLHPADVFSHTGLLEPMTGFRRKDRIPWEGRINVSRFRAKAEAFVAPEATPSWDG
ncbi:RNA-dependent RNA polymerase [Tacheng Tick Virus 3]|uniref:RNA-dependent RNA polymerase n=1 Tax=Tacheng Tick Virus 3 TaxID=1608085 RepID=UPI0005AD2A1D|nr:RNA-dependent RNA polymerase [Tacheng Tick Virus 3]AJG39138.1 RNA-dependent RNA polymerase [Tacheng Tick Virus 3]